MTGVLHGPGAATNRLRGWWRVAAAVLLLCAVASLGLAFIPETEQETFRVRRVDRWMLSAVAVALAVAAAAFWRRRAAFAMVAATFILGGAAQLFLTEALWFPSPNLRPKSALDWLMLTLIALEGAVALAVLGRAFLQGNLRPGVWIGPGLGVVTVGGMFSVSMMGFLANDNLDGYLRHLIAGTLLVAVHLGSLMALVVCNPPWRGVLRAGPGWLAFVSLLLSVMLCWFAFERLPHVEDEVAYLFQATTFAGGALTVPPPPEALRPGLEYYLLDMTADGWFSVTAPGWPMVLAFFVVRRVAGERAACLTALLMAVSPWLAESGASLMTHATTTALMLAAWWAVLKADDTPRVNGSWLFAAGLAMGLIFTTRQLDGVIAGGLTALWVGSVPARTMRIRLIRLAIFGIGCFATGSIYFLYNALMTGSIFLAPLESYMTREWGHGSNSYGFGSHIGPPNGAWDDIDPYPGHSATEGVLNTVTNLAALNLELFGWSIGSLGLIAVFLARGHLGRFDKAMVIVAATTMAAMYFYWFAGSFYIGPRYWFVLAIPVLYLSARGAETLLEMAGDTGQAHVMSALLVLCVYSALVFLPWRGTTKFYDYGNYHAAYRDAAASGQFGDAVVLAPKSGNVGSHLILIDPWLRDGRPVFLQELDTVTIAEIRRAMPGRALMRFQAEYSSLP